MCSSRLKFSMQMSLLFRTLAFKHAHNFIHIGTNQLPNRFKVPGAQAGSIPHPSRGSKGKLMHSLPTQVGKNTPLTWNTNKNSLHSYKKGTPVLNDPLCTPYRIPFEVCKRDSQALLQREQERTTLVLRFLLQCLVLTKSQKKTSGLPVPCHLGSYSKCFIPL